MKIVLSLNCGSSSLKFQVYNWSDKQVIAEGLVEKIGLELSSITYKVFDKKIKQSEIISNHEQAIEKILFLLTKSENACIQDINEIKAVGHRMVHGGEQFKDSCLITDEVIAKFEEMIPLAPLHNPANIMGVKAAQKALPNVPQIAVIDTAFHQTMPDYAYIYPLPYELYEKHHVRKYGFHGSSYKYIVEKLSSILKKPKEKINTIILHIGSGASVAAIKNGVSVDTSMGMTPVEGLMMGTRCGDIDPSLPTFLQKSENLNFTEVENILNKKSGVLGLTKKFTDKRDLIENMEIDPLCKLAFKTECYQAKKYIGAYLAVLNYDIDAIVFTAGTGENGFQYREEIMKGFENIGIKIDVEKNNNAVAFKGSKETEISTSDSKIKVLMIPTNEEIVIINDTAKIANL